MTATQSGRTTSVDDSERFTASVPRITGKRLTYAGLISKG